MLFELDLAAMKYWYISLPHANEAKYPTYVEEDKLDIMAAYPFPWQEEFIYFYGEPRKNTNMFSIISTFPAVLWGFILLTTICGYGFLVLANWAYRNTEEKDMVAKTDTFSLFLKVIGSLTEPDSVDIFKRWSTG